MSRASAVTDAHLVIVGGGCAGLSLARELAIRSPGFETVVLEQRGHYTNDRTWCFWENESHENKSLVHKEWPRWRLSAGQKSVTHQGEQQSYQMVRAADFYSQACDSIANSDNVDLILDSAISDIRRCGNHFVTEVNGRTLRSRYLIDTRPPALGTPASAKLYQVFSGVELALPEAVLDSSTAGLMERMRSDPEGFCFVYVLPMTRRQALVELTRFSTTPVTPESLDAQLQRELAARPEMARAVTLRREHGVLPMGLHRAGRAAPEGVVRAGIAGGALRASSGYGFLRIQAWATRCAERMVRGGAPLPQDRDSRLLRIMDSLFLNALRANPQRGHEFFLAIAETLGGDEFAAFMSGNAGFDVWRKVVLALPPGPFLRSISAVLDGGGKLGPV